MSASEIANAVRAGEVSATEIISECLARISVDDPWLHAFVTVCADDALHTAKQLDNSQARTGPLIGVPFAVKDITPTQGVRTTFGSKIYEHHVPNFDELCVSRLKAAGGILLGKTNTPEFGFGSRSVNQLCPSTASPFSPDRSAGGSSGGSAAAVASGMVPVAQGTDLGGSVRTPASFCGTFALRPTPSRIPRFPKPLAWDTLSTHGILARSLDDLALMLSVMSGRDRRDPTSFDGPARLQATSQAGKRSLRIAATVDFGIAPIAAEVRDAFAAVVNRIAEILPGIEIAHPDCTGAQAAFETLRAAVTYNRFKHLLAENEALLTEPARWNIAQGINLSADTIFDAEQTRSRIYQSFLDFFARFDVLIAPSASVLPFPNTQLEILEIDGARLRNPIDYLTVTYVVSLIGMPCLAVPCGVVQGRLPFGIQLVAAPRAEQTLFDCAGQLGDELGLTFKWPPTIRPTGGA
jgi:amidase